MRVLDLLPQVVLLVGAGAIILVTAFVAEHRQWLGAPLAAAALVASGVTQLVRAPAVARTAFEGQWVLDTRTTWGTVAIVVATLVTVLLSPRWLRTDRRHGEYYAVLLLGALGAQAMAAAGDLMELVVGLLLSSVTGYVLASYHRRSPLSAEAGIKFFLVGGMTNSLLLLGAVLVFLLGGTTLYDELATSLTGADPTLLVVAVGLVVVGVCFELGAVPAHAWVPDVAEGAPAPAAAFLTVAPKVGALLALSRFVEVLPEALVGWRPLVAVVAVATMTLGNLAAFWQDDVRRLLGWSSIAQAGYGLLGVVAIGRSSLAVPALLVFALAYTLGNLAAFGVVVALRGRTTLSDYAGLGRHRPWLVVALGIALLSLVGIPPLVGFTAKLVLFTATIEAGYAWLAVVAVINTVASLFYYLRVVAVAVFGEREGALPLLDRLSPITVVATALGLLVLGLGSGPVLAAVGG